MRYKLLVDMHCDRIVYFTSNIAEHTVIDDNLYICFYDGALPLQPREMTLRNCWAWKWNAQTDTLVYSDADPSLKSTLFDQNKQAAKSVLKNMINKTRKTLVGDYAFGSYIDKKIFEELVKPPSERHYIASIAEVTGKSTEDVYEEYEQKHKKFEDVLFLSEITRAHFERLIDECKTSDELYQIRNNIAQTNILKKYEDVKNT